MLGGLIIIMGPKQAVHATKLIRPSIVTPEHCGTFPVLEKNPAGFVSEMSRVNPQVKVLPIQPGENILV